MTAAVPDVRQVAAATGDDLDAARALFEGAYDAAGFLPERTARPFGYRFRSVGNATLTLDAKRFDGRMAGEVDATSHYFVTWVSDGGGVVDIGRDEVVLAPGRPVVFPSARPFRFDLADVRQNVVQFDRTTLEHVAAELHGTEPAPIVFDHAAAPVRSALRFWDAELRGTAPTVLGSAPLSPLAMAEAARRTAFAMLRTFPHVTLATRAPVPPQATGRVEQAIEYMHANVERPLSTTDVAEYVGLSVRGLQQGFQRQVGETPNGMLRGMRLDRVRSVLRSRALGEVTVAGVAREWGFAHAGRFSAAYAKRFGESPSETLRRPR
ncbi:AraC family transcriptional regulator [Curtobacterium sp. MCBA15_012]|uniref:helix-turn-helix transcriptional regulator n=1 Tax=Curtobacterium sp. MCBA15_012 TaxID=1898738 RepID=UPI0008DC975B|nr:AraC family transcriptional regulator [Curtobacterium sp. MCBA15_012]WIB01600.1 AraC family transcriptional regulator [Curtobacterium sp. MCBA15_012]